MNEGEHNELLRGLLFLFSSKIPVLRFSLRIRAIIGKEMRCSALKP